MKKYGIEIWNLIKNLTLRNFFNLWKSQWSLIIISNLVKIWNRKCFKLLILRTFQMLYTNVTLLFSKNLIHTSTCKCILVTIDYTFKKKKKWSSIIFSSLFKRESKKTCQEHLQWEEQPECNYAPSLNWEEINCSIRK